MKPLLMAAFLLAGTFTKSFALDFPLVNPNIQKTFRSTFAQATDVKWTVSAGLYQTAFFLNGQGITAYFTADGLLAATARHIPAAALPVMLQTALKEKCNDFWIADVVEVTNENGLYYYVTLENADQKQLLQSQASHSWSVYKKIRNL